MPLPVRVDGLAARWDHGGIRPTRVLCALATLVVAVAGLTACDPPSSFTFDGRGSGHGRGMGQWGALGYAVDHAWSGGAILGHFYGGTSTLRIGADLPQRVYISDQVGKPLVAYSPVGGLRVSADGYATPRKAVMVIRLSDSTFRVYTGNTCGGPWILTESVAGGAEVVVRPPSTTTEDLNQMAQLCTATGTRWYRGELLAVHRPGTTWTINRLGTEPMLRGVVPHEVSPSWADLGGGRGAAAVRAQALAARSYLLSGDTRWAGLATTCDNSTQCQAYDGVAVKSGSTYRKWEDPRTDKAIRDTARQVRIFASGKIARTEFSASSGGWTAGGTFPAVEDVGDDYAGNPVHTWRVSLTRAQVEAKLDAWAGRDLGTLNGIVVTQRNGLGADGGRVLKVDANFATSKLTLTGNQMRTALGLRSDWYLITAVA